MRPRHLLIVGVVLLGFAMLLTGSPRGALFDWLAGVAAMAFSLACPLFFIAMLLAPFLGFPMSQALQQGLQRLRVRRREIEELKYRITNLEKPHHMAELGTIYLQQGRHRRAAEWFEKVLNRDATLLDARYKLAVCRLHDEQAKEAAELFEDVHREKPGYEYGNGYLHLAKAQALAGNAERAREVYELLLKFYPGHPEGTYRYAELLDQVADRDTAREQMRRVITSVRNSPAFGRRRNGHWLWKAQWWLWRH